MLAIDHEKKIEQPAQWRLPDDPGVHEKILGSRWIAGHGVSGVPQYDPEQQRQHPTNRPAWWHQIRCDGDARALTHTGPTGKCAYCFRESTCPESGEPEKHTGSGWNLSGPEVLQKVPGKRVHYGTGNSLDHRSGERQQ